MSFVRFAVTALMMWFFVQVLYTQSAPLRHAHGIWLWPAKHVVARALGRSSHEAVLVTSR